MMGYRPFVLNSSSMMPTYKPGSLVLVDTSVSLSDVDIGDVLVYRGAGEVILHRLVGDNLLKGDANKEAQTFKKLFSQS